MPEMNNAFTELDGKPAVLKNPSINLGLAIDLAKPDGTRQLLVPSIKFAEQMDFAQFWAAYEDVVRRARGNKLTADDFAGTTISLTNPGTIGTVHSVPRLMQGQGTIIGVGAMEYPAEFQGASPETLARMAIGKTMTMTSTYDHRIIQGAQSGDFLRRVQPPAHRWRRLLRRGLPRAADPLRAVPLGGATSSPRTRTTSTRPRACSSSSTRTACAATSSPTPTRSSTRSVATSTST